VRTLRHLGACCAPELAVVGRGTPCEPFVEFFGTCGARRVTRPTWRFMGGMTSHRGRSAGFSLIEVLCAILILGIGLVGLTQGLTTALSSSKESELQTNAALIAAGRIEMLRADGIIIDGEDEGEGTGAFSLYRWKQSVTGTTINGLHEVEVVVENAKSGQPIYELRTFLFDPPLLSTMDEPTTRKDSASSRKRDRRQR
jgi:prepilin-type N-terminal cleavage/methylation domain-containing protein